MTLELYKEKLQRSPLKTTPKRVAVIRILHQSGGLLIPEEVFARMKKEFKRCGLPGVYRNLESLAACGILARIHRFDNKRYYGLCPSEAGSHHHHIVCVQCGRIGEVAECGMFGRRMINGFKVVGHFLQVQGVCAVCRKEN